MRLKVSISFVITCLQVEFSFKMINLLIIVVKLCLIYVHMRDSEMLIIKLSLFLNDPLKSLNSGGSRFS